VSPLDRIAQIAINVHDLKRATAFYRDVLGLRLLFEVPNLACFDCGGIRLMLGAAEKPEFDHPGSILYYQVADIKGTHAELTRLGVQFEDTPHVVAPLGANDLWMTFCHDSEGNLLALTSEVPR
jgi:methylmalonyl-CoA/ethylmalonyl-CoA epimerase